MNKDFTNMHCCFCGGELIWQSDFDISEVFDDVDENDSAIVTYYTCRLCGREYRISEPTCSERKNIEYWNEK